MTTIVNTPGNGDNSGFGFLLGIIIVAVAVILFVVYGLPAIRASKAPADTTNITVQIPTPVTGTSEPAPAE
jgi:hypothetical protein